MAEAAQRRLSRPGVLAIVLGYAGLAALWIVLSDRAAAWLFPDPAALAQASTVKGGLFVAVTSLLLYVLLSRSVAEPAARFDRHARLPALAIALAVLLLTGAGVAQVFRQQEDKEVARLLAIADLQTRQVGDWLAERQGDAEFARTSAFFADTYRDWRQRGDAGAGQRLRLRLEQLRANYHFGAISLYDGAGNRLWGSDHAPAEAAPALRAGLAAAAESGRVRRIGPYLGLAGHARLDFVVPVIAPAGPGPMIVLHVDPAEWLYPTLRNWPVPDASGETLLFRRDGGQVLIINQLRHRADAAQRLRVPVAGDRLVARVLRGDGGQGARVGGLDYRGVPVVGVARAIAGTDWFLVAKLDRAEIRRRAAADAAWIGLAGALALVMLAAALIVLRQRARLAGIERVRRAQDERLEALQLLDAVAQASEEAIFAFDRAGRLVLFNRAAEAFTGKSAAEVIGRDETVLFPPELAAREMASNRRIMATGVGEVFEAVFPLPGGERTFLVAKQPLRDRDGRVAGLCGSARDISARSAAEHALAESEARFRALVEQSLAGIYIIQDGRFAYVNPGFAAIFGYDGPDQIVGQVEVTDLVSPADRERVSENIGRRLSGAVDDIHYAFTGLRRDGGRIEVEVHGRVFDYLGRPAVIGLILDISARKAAEESLRASELRFHDIAKASADWVWEIDAEGRFTYASDSVFDLLGYTPAEIIGRTPFDLMPAEEAARVAGEFAAIVARRAPFRDLDNVNRHKDGSLRHIQSNGIPVLGDAGELLGYRGMDRDVSERKRAEQALRESEARFRALFDSANVAIMLHDHDTGAVVEANPRALAIYGYASLAELCGHALWLEAPYGREEMVHWLRRAAEVGGQQFEWHAMDRHGRRFWLDVSLSRAVLAGVERVISVASDITARKQAEATLRRQADELARHNAELERFNRASVDRELDMIALKQRVNAMAVRLGEAPPYRLDFLAEAGADGTAP